MTRLNVPYISQIDEGRPVNDCGPACALMVARAYGLALNTTIDDLYRQHGYPDTGLYVSTIMALLDSLGVPNTYIRGDLQRLEGWLQAGFPAILLVDLWAGHFVVATGLTPDGFTIHDPYYRGDDGANIEVSDARMEAIWGPHDQYHYTAIVPNAALPIGDDVVDKQTLDNIEMHLAAIGSLVDDLRGGDAPAPEPEPEPDYAVMYVSGVDPATLRVRDAAGFGGAVVGGLPEGTQVTVYERSGDWARIGVDRWVYASYLDFQPRR